MTDSPSQLEQIASRAISLYSRPTVALELMRLAEEPSVEPRTLKDCIAQDPALTCKVLRVVNSSLYGLSRPVADLGQAINHIGIKPLKLLVLGFNLPDALFAEVAARQLQWYWTNTLTRAVAARMISEQLWYQPGDEAFIAGLMQDIGILVLLRELGEPYARFLTGVIDENCHLASLEQDTIGFDHIQLSAALLARWQLPQRLVDAVATPKRAKKLARLSSPEGDLPQILHLAEMLMQLAGQRRFQVLPDLLEAGRVYRGMTKSKLAALVEGLQPQVDQLAGVLSLELTAERDYVQMLVEAHRRMSELTEQIAGRGYGNDDQAYNQLLAHTHELSDAMKHFLAGREQAAPDNSAGRRLAGHAAHERGDRPDSLVGQAHSNHSSTLLRKLAAAGNRCRERRHELSLVLIESSLGGDSPSSNTEAAHLMSRRALGVACAMLEKDTVTLVSLSDAQTAAILCNCERRTALAVAHKAIAELTRPTGDAMTSDLSPMLSVGVATISAVPKNFDPKAMVESAARCLSAARAAGISAVKSIEV
jgi:HD-like signal output (HDOD) protein